MQPTSGASKRQELFCGRNKIRYKSVFSWYQQDLSWYQQPMSRKALPKAIRKSETIRIRLTFDQKKSLERHVHQIGATGLSTWLLMLGLRAMKKERVQR